MFPNYIGFLVHKKKEINIYIYIYIRNQINKLISTGNNSTYNEPLSGEWIERRS